MKSAPSRFDSIHRLASFALASVVTLAGSLVAGCADTPEKQEPPKSSPPPSQPPPKPPPKPPPDRAHVSEAIDATAKIVAIDRTERLLVLRGQDGTSWVVKASPEVRNFDQIDAGDSVRVRYLTSLAVALKKPGESTAAPSTTVAAARAAPGQTPAAGVAAQITKTVRIESVDKDNNIVVFTPPGGGLSAVSVERPEGREFIRGLKRGDQVEITYTEAVALSVEKQ